MQVSYDIIRIGSILQDISRYFNDLGSLNIQDVSDLSDSRNFYAASMILFALLNRVFDLGSEVIIARRSGIPTTYREIFSILEQEGIITHTLAQSMKHFVTCRNLLSHEYQGITPDLLFTMIGEMGTIRTFVECLQDTVERET
ncbi:MAG TPA: DUF86 domain-containing protein [Methanolinea sp.]|nr:DUF86 domain-containing protein [Methanolinea sp.]HQK56633.1 DUF86 domain-containing protein [Methanolinea sp.]